MNKEKAIFPKHYIYKVRFSRCQKTKDVLEAIYMPKRPREVEHAYCTNKKQKRSLDTIPLLF